MNAIRMSSARTLFLVLSAALLVFAASAHAHQKPEGFSGFEDPSECGGCHDAIYREWEASMHANSSKFADPVHSAVHEAFAAAMKSSGRKPNYHCASCHMPTADNMAALASGDAEPVPPHPANSGGVTCSFCHKVDGLVEGEAFHTYRLTDVLKGPDASMAAPHGLERSEFASSYLMCLGCHGKKVAENGVVICSMDEEGLSDCLTCHMARVDGPPSAGSAKTTHAFHGMHGGHDEDMLKKGATLSMSVEAGRLVVGVYNPNPHYFPSTNPMRVAYVKVEVFGADGGVIFSNFYKDPSEQPDAMFMKVFRSGDKVGVPTWEADGVAVDTRLASKEERVLVYGLPDRAVRARARLYYRLMPGPAIEKFRIPADGVVEVPKLVSEAELVLK